MSAASLLPSTVPAPPLFQALCWFIVVTVPGLVLGALGAGVYTALRRRRGNPARRPGRIQQHHHWEEPSVGIMSPAKPDPRQQELLDVPAGLRADIKALRTERENVTEVNRLRDDVERLKREKATLVEEQNRKIRETEHKVGLLKLQQDHEVANAKRETELEVREANLAADKDRFTKDMEFQRERLQGEVDRVERVLNAILERLPAISVDLAGDAVAAAKKRSGSDGD